MVNLTCVNPDFQVHQFTRFDQSRLKGKLCLRNRLSVYNQSLVLDCWIQEGEADTRAMVKEWAKRELSHSHQATRRCCAPSAIEDAASRGQPILPGPHALTRGPCQRIATPPQQFASSFPIPPTFNVRSRWFTAASKIPSAHHADRVSGLT